MKLFNFLPKEEKFYTYLTDLCTEAHACADLLKSYVTTDNGAERTRLSCEVSASKSRSKKIMGTMTGDLCRSFITPFDREDIQGFAQQLYRITKIIEKVVQRMEMHDLKNAKGDLARQTDLIVSEAKVMDEMVRELITRRNTKHITEKATLLNDMEQMGDDILEELLKSLFDQKLDARELILRKDIYDMLEKVIDGYRNAASVTLEIVLKYS